MKNTRGKSKGIKADTSTYEQSYSQDPMSHGSDTEARRPDTDLESPEAPDATTDVMVTKNSVEVEESTDSILNEPLQYVVSAPDAIDKAEVLLQKVKEARPDLAQDIDQLLNSVENLENKAMGVETHEEAPAAPAAPQQPGAAPQAQPGAAPQPNADGVNPGDRVVAKTKDGEFSGVVEDINDDGTLEILTDKNMKLSHVPADSVEKEKAEQTGTMSLPTGIRSSRRQDVRKKLKASEGEAVQELDKAEKGFDKAENMTDQARRQLKRGNKPAMDTMADVAKMSSDDAEEHLAEAKVKASPKKQRGMGAGRTPAASVELAAGGSKVTVSLTTNSDGSTRMTVVEASRKAANENATTIKSALDRIAIDNGFSKPQANDGWTWERKGDFLKASKEELSKQLLAAGLTVKASDDEPKFDACVTCAKPFTDEQKVAGSINCPACNDKENEDMFKGEALLNAKKLDPQAQMAVKAAKAQFLSGTLDLTLMAAYHPAAQAEVKRLLADKTLKLAASAFDKLDSLDIGGGFKAERGKKGKGEEANTVVIVDKDGKEVAKYPDAFGDDTVTIIKLLRQLHDIKESDDKKAASSEDKGETEGESKKPKALPKVEEKEEKKDEELEAAQRNFEQRLTHVREVIADRVSKRYVVAHQDDIDALLLKGMGLEASMNEALKAAVDREVLRLLALPDTELLTIRASLGRLQARPVEVETKVSNEGLQFTAGLQLYAEKATEEGLGLQGAFGSSYRR